MFQHIWVVCVGNICRSPVAAAMLRQALPDRRIESAGLSALVGQDIDPLARQVAEEAGLCIDSHKARQLSPDMLHTADLVLVMSDGQRRAVADLSPHVLGKTLRIGHWLDSGRGRDIPDPYRKSREAFEHVHQLLEAATAAWAAKL